MVPPLRIGTRASALAMAQASEVKARIIALQCGYTDETVILVPMTTTGDHILDRNLAEIGGKALFTKEIEEALLAGTVDIAVHSMKDVPAFLPEGLIIECILPREDPRDALVSAKGFEWDSLPGSFTLGSSSARRKALILHHRPQAQVVPFRGNVLTRLQKMKEGLADATILAVAGLKRLAIDPSHYIPIAPTAMIPAVAQGAIGVECREDDEKIRTLLTKLHDEVSGWQVEAERAFLIHLGGSCKTPLAAHAIVEGEQIQVTYSVANLAGTVIYRTERCGAVKERLLMGKDAAEELLTRAGPDFFTY